MKAFFPKSTISGKAAALPSKDYTIRALMCAALARGESLIRNPLKSDDTAAATGVLTRVGARIAEDKTDWRVTGSELKTPSGGLFCRESVATLQFMTAISSVVPSTTRLVTSPSLIGQPTQLLLDALTKLGVVCRLEGGAVVVDSDRLIGGEIKLGFDINTQYVSALLLVAALAEKGLVVEFSAPPLQPSCVLMTLECLRLFGIHVQSSPDLTRLRIAPQSYMPATYQVEGDWLQASYLLALGALAGEMLVTNLNAESLQSERAFINMLQKMGVRFSQRGGSVMVSRSYLRAINIDLGEAIELLPAISVLAAMAVGESEIRGISNERLKESGYVGIICEEFGNLGIRTAVGEDSLKIIGGQPKGKVIDTRSDGHLGVAFAVLGAAIGDVTVLGTEGMDKVFPDFWRAFRDWGGKVELKD